MPPPNRNGSKPILYSLKQRFGNPLKKGIFTLTNSSRHSSYPTRVIENILEWDLPNGWHSENEENQYFIIDFKEGVVSINGYGLRPFLHDHVPLEWKIFVSNDNSQWIQVDHKTENLCDGYMDFRNSQYPDANFCMQYLEKFYDIDNIGYYHMIKMQQIGLSSGSQYQSTKGDSKAFYLGAFEIYGEIRVPLSKNTPKCDYWKLKLSYLVYTLFMSK